MNRLEEEEQEESHEVAVSHFEIFYRRLFIALNNKIIHPIL